MIIKTATLQTTMGFRQEQGKNMLQAKKKKEQHQGQAFSEILKKKRESRMQA